MTRASFLQCAPSGASFQQVQVLNPPGHPRQPAASVPGPCDGNDALIVQAVREGILTEAQVDACGGGRTGGNDERPLPPGPEEDEGIILDM